MLLLLRIGSDLMIDKLFQTLVNQMPDKTLVGKVVLDLGGLPGAHSDKLFELGVAEVHGINLSLPEHAKISLVPNYFHHLCDARDLSPDIPLADAAVGFNVLEHIPDLKNVLKGIFTRLKNKSPLIMHGGGFWTSCLGHHCYVFCEDKEYLFGTITNPLENWSHLLHTPYSMQNILLDKEIPVKHVNEIIDQIYFSDVINRYRTSEVKEAFILTNQYCIGFETSLWSTPNIELFNLINAKVVYPYSTEDFMTGEMIAICRKW